MGCDTARQPIAEVGRALFADLRRVAELLDQEQTTPYYRQVCDQLVEGFDDPDKTFSARILAMMLEQGSGGVGLQLSAQYREQLLQEPLEILSETQFASECERSWQHQRQLESEDTLSFDAYLAGQ
ncbi:hypothetical protein OS21_45190 [Dickeya oryzae]